MARPSFRAQLPIVFLCACLLGSAHALHWEQGAGFRGAKLVLPPSGKTGFTRLSPAAIGIGFTNLLSADRSMTNSPANNGSGVAAGDVDGDGWCDLYFCGLESPNILYRNLGNIKFEDITLAAGVACPGQLSTGAVFADIDGDGDLDLLVNALDNGTRAFLNDGNAHFREITRESGLNSPRGSMSLALADIDGDSDLDLYVATYRPTVLTDELRTRFTIERVNGSLEITKVNGIPVSDPQLVGRFTISPSGGPREHGQPDVLYRNDGTGRFTVVSWTDGSFLNENYEPIATPYDWGLGMIFRDFNQDGAPDIYVCNDSHSVDRFWINDGKGRFRAAAPLAIRRSCLSSMGVDVADINRDGYDDFIVLDMMSLDHDKRLTQLEGVLPAAQRIGQFDDRPQYPRNMLYLNHGDGTYAEIAFFSGLPASEWSWTPTFLDVDLDGFEDLLVSNGFPFDIRDVDANHRINAIKAERKLAPMDLLFLRKLFPRYETPNLAFRNRGDLTFEKMDHAWGFSHVGISHGMTMTDLDNDGDLDIALNNLNDSAGVYRNDSLAPRLALQLKGDGLNRHGIGARIKVLGGAVPMQSQEIICGGRYLSGDQPIRVFAAGTPTNLMTIEVSWRSGKKSIVTAAKANWIYELDEAKAVPAASRF